MYLPIAKKQISKHLNIVDDRHIALDIIRVCEVTFQSIHISV